jgi:ElaB/YqjD/DUF883 family membrane-anchored ribosome-binding protein
LKETKTMSQNFGNETGGTTGTGTSGSTSGSTGGGTPNTGSTGLSTTGSTGGAATGTATATDKGIAAKAKEYGQQVAEYGQQAKDYIADKASVVGDKIGDKIQDLRNVDYGQLAEDAKDYARQKPGQALLIAAAAGFVIGLLVRGGRR